MTIALVPIGRNTLKILLALGALEIPAGAGTVPGTLWATLAIIFSIVLAVAVLTCTPVTSVAMAMTLTWSTATSDVLANDKVALDAFFTLNTHGVVLAETTYG